jgi:hypothetical protein
MTGTRRAVAASLIATTVAVVACSNSPDLPPVGGYTGTRDGGSPDATTTTPMDSGTVDSHVGDAREDGAMDSSIADSAVDDSAVADSAIADSSVGDGGDGQAYNDGATKGSDASDASSFADADAGAPPQDGGMTPPRVSCAGAGDSVHLACGNGDPLPAWTFDVTYSAGTGGSACATLGADAGVPACVPCMLASNSDTPQCTVSIVVGSAMWSLAYDPVNGYVYVTEVVSTCPANGGWTPRCN